MPEKLIEGLKEGVAVEMAFACVELRLIEQALDEMAVEFEGADPLKPRGREILEGTKRKLLKQQEQLQVFQMAVVLQEPSPEELDELRTFVRQRA